MLSVDDSLLSGRADWGAGGGGEGAGEEGEEEEGEAGRVQQEQVLACQHYSKTVPTGGSGGSQGLTASQVEVRPGRGQQPHRLAGTYELFYHLLGSFKDLKRSK